jgi:hypothetical protein
MKILAGKSLKNVLGRCKPKRVCENMGVKEFDNEIDETAYHYVYAESLVFKNQLADELMKKLAPIDADQNDDNESTDAIVETGKRRTLKGMLQYMVDKDMTDVNEVN